jgi:hypothetical protein
VVSFEGLGAHCSPAYFFPAFTPVLRLVHPADAAFSANLFFAPGSAFGTRCLSKWLKREERTA